jgi:2-isopropylmalate synthase
VQGPINVIDATLRLLTAQAGALPIEPWDAAALVTAAKNAGVDMVEVGNPLVSLPDTPAEVARARACVSVRSGPAVLLAVRSMPGDLQKAAALGVSWVGVAVAPSAHTAPLDVEIMRLRKAVRLGKALGLLVRFTIEDAPTTPPVVLRRLYGEAMNCGADRLGYADSMGRCEPAEVAFAVRRLRKAFGDIPLEVQVHDDRGLALANTLAAIDAGADWVSTSANGIGARCGVTDTCALLANLHHRRARKLGSRGALSTLSRLAARAAGVPVACSRPVTGRDAFAAVPAGVSPWIDPKVLGEGETAKPAPDEGARAAAILRFRRG